MARNILRAGHELTVYNRTRSKTEALAGEGAKVADSPAGAAAGAEVLVSVLADDPAVRAAVLDGGQQRAAIEGLSSGAIHISCSTISVEMAQTLEAAHRARGQHYVSATVLGRPEAAAAKQLWVVAAGAPADIERCRPVIDAIGRGASTVGQEPWKSNLIKIGVNFMLASMLESLGEAFALMEKFGASPSDFLEAVNGGLFRSPVIEQYGLRVLEKRYAPAGFSLKLGLKDTNLALQAGSQAQVPLPIASILRDRYLQALAQGQGEIDWSSIAEISRRNAFPVTQPAKSAGTPLPT